MHFIIISLFATVYSRVSPFTKTDARHFLDNTANITTNMKDVFRTYFDPNLKTDPSKHHTTLLQNLESMISSSGCVVNFTQTFRFEMPNRFRKSFLNKIHSLENFQSSMDCKLQIVTFSPVRNSS